MGWERWIIRTIEPRTPEATVLRIGQGTVVREAWVLTEAIRDRRVGDEVDVFFPDGSLIARGVFYHGHRLDRA